jgi:hypothetical protein
VSINADLELIRELHPQAAGASAHARERARTALVEAIADAAHARRRRARGRFRLPLVPSIGLVGATVVFLAALLLATELRGGAARPAPAAAAVLERAARAAEASGGPRELRPGEYWYVHSRWTTAGVLLAGGDPRRPRQIIAALGSIDRQVWIGLGKPGLVSTRVVGPITFLSAAARQQWVRYGRPAQLDVAARVPLPRDAFDVPYKQLLALPTNVNQLWRVIKHDAGKGSASWQRHEMFTVVGDLMREDPVPARVRAALYRVAARIPGIRVLGLTDDAIGRPALAIGLSDVFNGMRVELLFDPRTASLLAETSVVVRPPPAYHVKPGTVRTGATYLAAGIVQRIGQRQGGGSGQLLHRRPASGGP